MAVHSFWEANLTDHKGRKHPPIMVHAVGLPHDEPEAIEEHLRKHNFRGAKEIALKPANGLINFHGYPVKGANEPTTTNVGVTDGGDKVDMTSGQILGPDNKPIQIQKVEELPAPIVKTAAEPKDLPKANQAPQVGQAKA